MVQTQVASSGRPQVPSLFLVSAPELPEELACDWSTGTDIWLCPCSRSYPQWGRGQSKVSTQPGESTAEH